MTNSFNPGDNLNNNPWGTGSEQNPSHPTPGPEYNPAPAATNIAGEGKGLFSALFDFSFRRFVTIDFVKVIYIIFVGIYGITWGLSILFSLAAFTTGFAEGLVALFMAVVVGGILFFLAVIGARVTLEFFVSMVRTAQNTSELVAQNKLR